MVDLILCNANVRTMDSAFPRAREIAIRKGRILLVTNRGLPREFDRPGTKRIDCRGKTVLPGFIDPHLHFQAFAESLLILNLWHRKDIRSIPDIRSEVRKFAQGMPKGTWIRSGGYDEFHLQEKRHPTRWDLDPATPDHPLKLTHRSGHAHVLNSLGLRMAGISRETPDPPDGWIDRALETGEPTGLLYGMGDWLAKAIPPLDESALKEGIRRASQSLLSSGITSFQDASHRNDIERWRSFSRWKAEGLIRSRACMMMGYGHLDGFRREGFPSPSDASGNEPRLTGVKILVEETTGRLNPSQEELNEILQEVHEQGLQAVLHAIEEGPIEAACRAVEYALRKTPRKDRRHRIEHCSVCPPPLADRIAGLGITVVTHPSFLYYNGERYLQTVPENQRRYLYPIGTLKRKGVLVVAGSDCPIVPPCPLIGIYSAVTRMSETGEAVLSDEGLDVQEALRMHTQDAARATFEEDRKGSVTPGKVADLVVLDRDPHGVSCHEIKDIRIEMTIIGGEVVWDTSGGG